MTTARSGEPVTGVSNQRWRVKGRISSLCLASLSAGKAKQLPYSFRYYTNVEQSVTLPADFKAERVTIEIRPAQKSAAPYRQTFVWNPDVT